MKARQRSPIGDATPTDAAWAARECSSTRCASSVAARGGRASGRDCCRHELGIELGGEEQTRAVAAAADEQSMIPAGERAYRHQAENRLGRVDGRVVGRVVGLARVAGQRGSALPQPDDSGRPLPRRRGARGHSPAPGCGFRLQHPFEDLGPIVHEGRTMYEASVDRAGPTYPPARVVSSSKMRAAARRCHRRGRGNR